MSSASRRLLLRWISIEGFSDHLIDLALDLGGVALFLASDGTPDQGTCTRIAQVDHQRALAVRHPYDAPPEAIPPGGIGLQFGFLSGSKVIAHVQVGWTSHLRQAPSHERPFDIGLDLFLDQVTFQSRVVAVQLTSADG